jgi:thiamine biosynthesis lipoprotein
VTAPAGVRLDLGATAKAWAADQAAATLAEAAGCGVLVSLGGDTAVAGEPPAEGWQIRVQDVAGPVDTTPTQGAAHHGRPAQRRPRHLGHGSPHLAPRRPPPPPHRRPAHRPPRPHTLAHGHGTAALVKGAGAERWLTGLRLPAQLVAQDGTVVTPPGWPTPAAPGPEAAA